ncbi:MAG TPA: head GIN domain-containing protein [Fimbriimonadaceae bacterium]|nr:head GIN domain-containing protein [Fimbriimonadaceae bacterium]
MRSTVLLTPFLAGCALMGGLRGSGVQKTETRSIGAFKRIELIGAGEVNVSVGATSDLKLEIDDNLAEYITTEIEGDALVIRNKRNISSTIGPRIRVGAERLQAITISGSGKVKAMGISAKAFDATISGSGSITLEGKTDQLHAAINGSGAIDAERLEAGTAEVSIRGSGSALVDAMGALSVSISGSGSVLYAGNPAKIEQSITGSGTIGRKQ